MAKVHLQIENKVAAIIIDSPPANALSSEILKEIEAHFHTIEQSEEVKAVLIKGDGRFFCAGADIKEFTDLRSSEEFSGLAKRGHDIFNRIENSKVPVIAAIHGAALGGGLELAMCCHIRIVTKEAMLGLPEITLGIIPGYGGTQRLPRYVGEGKALTMMLTGESIKGEEAVESGLATLSVEEDVLDETAQALAAKITSKSTHTIEEIVQLVVKGQTHHLEEGLKMEAQAFANVFGKEDAEEGIKAFIEKREPHFKDR